MKDERIIYQIIAECLERRRGELNLSKRQLSKMTGITPVYLREVLRGDRKPSVMILMALCEAMNLKTSDLFLLVEEKMKTPIV